MKVATWNVNGIRARQAQVLEWLARARADVVCLQELKATPEQIQSAPWEAEGYWCHWHGAKAYSGVGLLVRHEFRSGEPVEVELVLPERPNLFVAGLVTFCRYTGQGYYEIGISLRNASTSPVFSQNPRAAAWSVCRPAGTSLRTAYSGGMTLPPRPVGSRKGSQACWTASSLPTVPAGRHLKTARLEVRTSRLPV